MLHARSLAAAAVSSALALPALAQPAVNDCTAIVDDAQRLACYDRAAGRKPLAANPATDAAEAAAAASAAAAAAATVPPPSVIERRRAEQLAARESEWFALTAHRTNYVLPVSYIGSPNWNRYEQFGDTGKLKNYEVKYQLSLKTALWPDIGGSPVDLSLAFTLQSWWQAYASDVSAPFRETNYEPEIFLTVPISYSLGGLNLRAASLGINHQSNGRSDIAEEGSLSRSWNRVVGSVVYDFGGSFAGYGKLWWRIPESDEDDDNPNIERYMGQAELGLAYRWRQHTFAGILKNNLRSDNQSGLQLDWTFPLLPHLKGYVQVYSGYGENMIDGDRYINRAGLGLMLSDWF
jgi:phospholipase A1